MITGAMGGNLDLPVCQGACRLHRRRSAAAFKNQRFRRIAEELKREQLAFDARENRRQSRISKLQVALLKAR